MSPSVITGGDAPKAQHAEFTFYMLCLKLKWPLSDLNAQSWSKNNSCSFCHWVIMLRMPLTAILVASLGHAYLQMTLEVS